MSQRRVKQVRRQIRKARRRIIVESWESTERQDFKTRARLALRLCPELYIPLALLVVLAFSIIWSAP